MQLKYYELGMYNILPAQQQVYMTIINGKPITKEWIWAFCKYEAQL